ncbi:Indolepyruvate:ferredoxin oxidoreductase (IOR), alpha subunit [Acidilobus saccharovorans 345-15]|uniref:Indolepyruvate oxidoreductase subunit IorA n=1 Tax=Acidilobus saccharovorans (strain DSM 16705 / JCM 18335 / VKM B-2471 / 345-15) TaxID=666510 RepID=D9Q130_ACIS3|nr:indolepyruvate ferredoxin oxidoreductase subunit alpha [Acidilobus saccharovorans]ADL19018.1 Indolepyruvate:ferredoxin oxidoreductase (IOR), alpha subunit [Acidilobus saccharovorans 345-15]
MYRILGRAGSTALLMGNEAVARGFLEAGGGFAAGYPGTPSTEVIESLAEVAKEAGIYVEWSSNEKVAVEAAYGASLAGVRSIATMKHVGLNVAADALMSIAYTGVRGGMLVFVAGDPSMWSSQNEQDDRYYGLISYVPVLTPSDPQEAKDLTVLGLDLSEKFSHPFMMVSTTRVSHTRGPVVLGPLRPPRTAGKFERARGLTLVPAVAREQREKLISKWEDIRKTFAGLGQFNRVEGDGDVAIVTDGVAYGFVKESLSELGPEADKVKVVKIATPLPFPRSFVIDAISNVKRVLVVEELEPVVEGQLKQALEEERLTPEVHGKDLVGLAGELTLDRVRRAVRSFLGLPVEEPRLYKVDLQIPPRPPAFCPGCPHRATFYALRRAVNRLRLKAIYSGDIGCYSLGLYEPFREQDIIIEMGGSVGAANGLAHAAQDQVPIAIIGDSTFFHAGIPGLINAMYNRAPMLLLVLDNRTTAMTGEQPDPGSGVTAMGDEAPVISIEGIARGIGIEKVVTFDPFDINGATNAMAEALEYVVKERRPAVAVARRACALDALRRARKAKVQVPLYQVEDDKCTACGICYNAFSCPAIFVKDDRKAWIDPSLCTGCGVCAEICPYKAIVKVVQEGKGWEEAWM